MTINWRDIQDRAVSFVHNYKDAKDEDRDAKPFWKDLFGLFGIDPRTIGSFEERVKMEGHAGTGKMDYFAPRRFLIEQKSRGKDLEVAYRQAMDYFDALKPEDKPRHIIISDFERIWVYDLEASEKKRKTEILLKDLPKQIKKLSFLADEDVVEYGQESAINVKAVRAVGKLHKALKNSHYPTEDLSTLLTRLVFCFFADDTGIFAQNALRSYLSEQTKEDGTDIGAHLALIFDVLDTKESERQITMHDDLLALPYVNGGLFASTIKPVFGSREVRDILLECFAFDWSEVSPAIFGSMFQSVMDEKERHDLGAHYTSERNILKVIGPLFLDEFHTELDLAKSEEKLRALWEKISRVTLLDPACGCGNFLVISYRELRLIEIEIVKRLDKAGKKHQALVDAGQAHLGLEVDLSHLSRMSVESMYGIEIERFPAEIAKLSLWLMDHMMNMELGAYYGMPLRKLPLTEAPHIVNGNALRLNWEEVVPKEQLTHILGNPPFLGARIMSAEQKGEIEVIFSGVKGAGNLDYVTGWYQKASDLMRGTRISCAFVSTNSITQGEQVDILWKHLLKTEQMYIHFAHRTFKWSNEASGKAAVYCVIVGFGAQVPINPRIFFYDDIRGEPKEMNVHHINAYLIDAPDVFVGSRNKPLCDVPEINFGNMPNDGGYFLFGSQEKEDFLLKEPDVRPYLREFISAQEFLNGGNRYCLWLEGVHPQVLKGLPGVLERIQAVRSLREKSPRDVTRKLAATPFLFGEIRQPKENYVLIPRVSSENRNYVPMGFFSPEQIVSDTCFAVPNATLYHFGILESEMHMAWMRAVAGRLESRYRYSKDIVYNNFPWPEEVGEETKKRVESAAQAVLDVRAQFSDATLADLYDPNTMPKVLLDAHKTLDRAVDACYGKKPSDFPTEPARLEFLFAKYQELIARETPKKK